VLRQPTPFFFEQGPQAVILLHAYSGSSNDVRLLARFLQRHDYTVYAPIFTGLRDR
jgi:Esterase/lipase